MARTSGRIGNGDFKESFAKSAFVDPASGADYRVTDNESVYRLSFEKPSDDVRGERKLEWFLGSGRVGRSFLFSLDGFLYQSPVSYYSATQDWAGSPGYRAKPSIDLTRAVGIQCLQCHASRLAPVSGTQNQFRQPPFLESGISCERCHGTADEHVKAMRVSRTGKRSIINPAKLGPAQRDSICAQCHLTGAARVSRLAAKSQPFRAGDLLTDTVAVYAWSDAKSSPVTVTSHFEKLAYSKCKQSSGDRLWCSSCHDPHGEPADPVAHYRQRCLSCHETKGCKLNAAARQASGNDCQSCHMPKAAMTDSEHAVYTDHSIPMKPESRTAATGEHRLVPFWTTPADARDAALAHAVIAVTEPPLRQEAFQLLRAAESRDPNDAAIAAQLAQFYDRMGRREQALPLFERVLALDPENVAAAINLGTLYAQSNRFDDAVRVWGDALKRNPALTGARVNMAVAQVKLGNRDAAIESLRTALRFDPDAPAVRRLLSEIEGR